MKFLELGKKGENGFSLYLGTIGIVFGSFLVIGQLPMTVALASQSDQLGKGLDLDDLAGVLGLNTYLTFLLIPFIIGLASLLLCVKFVHKRPVISLFTNRPFFDWKRFFFSFFLWGSVLALFLIIAFLTGVPIHWNYKASTFIELLLISIFLLPLQTTFEEVFLRGYLLQGIWNGLSRAWLSIVITSLLFCLMHFANPEVAKIGYLMLVFYLMNGLFLGLLAVMDDGLELSMGYHAVNNIFAALIVTNSWQALHTDALFIDHSLPEFGAEAIVTLLVVHPLLIILCAKKYKWTGWKERIFGGSNFENKP
jgi:uncharacterized protein